MNYLLLSKRKWNNKNYLKLNKKVKFSSKLNSHTLKKHKPKIIFFLHWSKKIPKKVFNNFTCIQFHSSNLPKFRGGSPIQNQIYRGVKKTKISAFRVNSKIDAGEICLKKDLSLNDNANKIYERIEKIAIMMINTIINKKKLIFIKQNGKISYFKRRKPKDSNLKFTKEKNLKNIYDFIRMLDAKDYPKAFINLKKFRIFFKNAKLKKKEIKGEFEIIRK